MDAKFMDRLELLRSAYGDQIKITSAYRSAEHNAEVSHTGAKGPHTTGRAVDIAVQGGSAHKLLKEALALGFTGIGIQQTGGARFIHLDDLTLEDGFPRPMVWSY